MDHQLKNRSVTHKNVQLGQNGLHGPNVPRLVGLVVGLVPECVHTVPSKQLQPVAQANQKRQNPAMIIHVYLILNGPTGQNGQNVVRLVVEAPKPSTELVGYHENPGS